MSIPCTVCLLVLIAVFSKPIYSAENSNSTDRVVFSYRSLLHFALSSPQPERLGLAEETKNTIILGMLQARASVPPIDDELMREGGFERFLVNMGLAAGAVEIDLKKIWASEFSEAQQRKVIGAYLGSYGLRAFQSPALQEYFGLSKSQIIKLDQVLSRAIEADRKRWQKRDKEELPVNFLRMHTRLALADRVLAPEQMKLLIEIVNDPDSRYSVKFTLGF
jgi:hypothetical protein